MCMRAITNERIEPIFWHGQSNNDNVRMEVINAILSFFFT